MLAAGTATAAATRTAARREAGSRPIRPTVALAASGSTVWTAQPGARRGSIIAYGGPTLARRRRVAAGARPTAVAISRNTLWVANDGAEGSVPVAGANTVVAFEARSGRRLRALRIVSPARVVADGSGAWILTPTTLVRLRTRPVRVAWRRSIPREAQAIASDGRSVWVSVLRVQAGRRPWGLLYRFEVPTGRLASKRRTGLVLTALAAGPHVLWGLGAGGGPVVRVTPAKLTRVAGIRRPSAVVATSAGSWAAGADGWVYRLGRSARVTMRFRAASSVSLLAASGRTLWLVDDVAGRLVRLEG